MKLQLKQFIKPLFDLVSLTFVVLVSGLQNRASLWIIRWPDTSLEIWISAQENSWNCERHLFSLFLFAKYFFFSFNNYLFSYSSQVEFPSCLSLSQKTKMMMMMMMITLFRSRQWEAIHQPTRVCPGTFYNLHLFPNVFKLFMFCHWKHFSQMKERWMCT